MSGLWVLLVWVQAVARISQVASQPGQRQSLGEWQLLMNNTGVVGMHMALTHLNTVVLFDTTGAGPSNYRLRRHPNGSRCPPNSNHSSCYAHSVEYDVSTNRIRPLVHLESDPWCSSGSFLSTGVLMQTGGYGPTGARTVRYFHPCTGARRTCTWQARASRNNSGTGRLSQRRWYASNVRLPGREDRVMVVGGRDAFSYEFVPKRTRVERTFDLPLLHSTYNRRDNGDNLYPFLHLSSDGHLFIFANRDSILLDYSRNRIVKRYPRIPGEGGRNYPTSGSSVILPLSYKDRFQKVEVMICGGAASGAYSAANEKGRYVEGVRTCGRMVITGNRHRWNMETMPGPRLLSDMVILPTGHILIVNGARRGAAGWDNADQPALTPFLYNPRKALGKRFSSLRSTKIPRMYHSSAVLLHDGRVLVAGSNPHNRYMFRGVRYPTELRLQAFVPPYMSKRYRPYRPQNVSIVHGGVGNVGDNSTSDLIRYGEEFRVRFWLGRQPGKTVEFSAYAPPFTTHSVGMNQRMISLRCRGMVRGTSDGWVTALLEAPPSPNVAPAGYYMLTVVNEGIPSISQWVRFMHH